MTGGSIRATSKWLNGDISRRTQSQCDKAGDNIASKLALIVNPLPFFLSLAYHIFIIIIIISINNIAPMLKVQ